MSIGCAVYNGEETLLRALDGLMRQTYRNVEIIICDDGSTDRSKEICRAFATERSWVRFIENPQNLGIVANFNKLFELSRGKYFFWADQDDLRAPEFVERCVMALETHPEAVLCHSATGVFWGPIDHLMHRNRIDRIAGDTNVLRRYWRFLRTYSDTTIYGLIRADALRRTSLWRSAPGSSNALLFELLLQGPFLQVEGTLYFYSARGVRRTLEGETERAFRTSPRKLMKPFVTLALNQAKGIVKSRRAAWEKAALLGLLWNHVLLVNGTKAAYRGVRAVGIETPPWFERACERLVYDDRDIELVVGRTQAPEYYASASPLRSD